MGFVSPEQQIIESLGVDKDQRDNVHAVYGDYNTSVDGVFAAGDCRRGQSLVVWAINEGRECADKVHEYLVANYMEGLDDGDDSRSLLRM